MAIKMAVPCRSYPARVQAFAPKGASACGVRRPRRGRAGPGDELRACCTARGRDPTDRTADGRAGRRARAPGPCAESEGVPTTKDSRQTETRHIAHISEIRLPLDLCIILAILWPLFSY